MKAIVEVAQPGNIFDEVLEDFSNDGSDDFHLSFESARLMFTELTPARLDLLNTLRKVGPCSVYALAKAADRNYSNVHSDVARLLDLGLVERKDDEAVFVPFDDVELHFHLAHAA